MVEAYKEKQNTSDGDQWKPYKDAGLLVPGTYTKPMIIMARTATGGTIAIEAAPVAMKQDGLEFTLFVPPPREAKKMAEIFPKAKRHI